MENVTPVMSLQHGVSKKTALNNSERLQKITAMCSLYLSDDDIYPTCWGEISRAALEANRFSAEQTLNFCDTASNKLASEQCKIRTIQELIAINPSMLTSIKNICKITQYQDPGFEAMCYTQLASVATQILPAWKTSEVINFCLSLENIYINTCIRQVGFELCRYRFWLRSG